MILQCSGDAMMNFAMCQSFMKLLDFSIASWQSVYKELVASNTKCQVKDKSKIRVNYSENKIVSPAGKKTHI